ncbi:hypothetical protein GBAR_LOCUS30288 [Geodia barretti]|uniref:Uncharacterized protein n=1 Tax=Geodia barretti TaxID=519541 RepID=A0AA35TXG2_GEOBA|nr:hypothetical protein GBAR_LOCUS30288 [Geodia barretti]
MLYDTGVCIILLWYMRLYNIWYMRLYGRRCQYFFLTCMRVLCYNFLFYLVPPSLFHCKVRCHDDGGGGGGTNIDLENYTCD